MYRNTQEINFLTLLLLFYFFLSYKKKKKKWVSTFNLFFVLCIVVHTYDYLHASLAEATPNDNPFVFHSLSSLRSMFCVFDFASLMLSFFSLRLSLSLPPSYDKFFPVVCRKRNFLFTFSECDEKKRSIDCSSGTSNECVCLTFRAIRYL